VVWKKAVQSVVFMAHPSPRSVSTAPQLVVVKKSDPGTLELFLQLPRRLRQFARPPVRAALWHQVERSVLDYGSLTAVIGALAGVFTVATVRGVGLGLETTVRVFDVLILGQLAGAVSALLLVAGPGTAAMAELGLMRHQGELRTLRALGIDSRDLLVLPRVVGFGLALFVLTFIFQLAAVIGGFALAALFTGASFTQQISVLATSLGPLAFLASGIRSLVLGGVIGLLACRHGLFSEFTPARMPEIGQQLLARSLVAIVVVQGGAAVLFR
jgi:ABC-type transporter Mla maintaining outer membrane lipid asymmetry permease subunit MlaE